VSVVCEWHVLSDRCLCMGLITRPEDSYQVWHVEGGIMSLLYMLLTNELGCQLVSEQCVN